jgi:hypothetical protein
MCFLRAIADDFRSSFEYQPIVLIVSRHRSSHRAASVKDQTMLAAASRVGPLVILVQK